MARVPLPKEEQEFRRRALSGQQAIRDLALKGLQVGAAALPVGAGTAALARSLAPRLLAAAQKSPAARKLAAKVLFRPTDPAKAALKATLKRLGEKMFLQRAGALSFRQEMNLDRALLTITKTKTGLQSILGARR